MVSASRRNLVNELQTIASSRRGSFYLTLTTLKFEKEEADPIHILSFIRILRLEFPKF